MKGSVAPPGFPRMPQEAEGHKFGDGRDGGGRLPTRLAPNRFSVRGCGHLPGSLVSAWEVIPPGFPWIQRGRGVNHYDSTMRETEGAELVPPNSAFRRSASRRGLRYTQRLCHTTRLVGCSTCAAFQPLHQNDIAEDLGESKEARDVLTT